MSQNTTTSQESQMDFFQELISSVEDSPVSPLVSPGSEEAQRMIVRSGEKCSALLKTQSPLGLLVRMCLGSSAWNSTISLMTWKVRATKRKRLLFLLVPLGRNISDQGFGFLHTPTRTANQGSPSMVRKLRYLPTPIASDCRDRGQLHQKAIQRRLELRKHMGLSMIAPGNGTLNPDFVEALMGYPKGWTDLDH